MANERKKKAEITAFAESSIFLWLITLVGGYLNGYTWANYEFLGNNHTGNISKFSIFLANGDWQAAKPLGTLMLFGILGAFFGAFMKDRPEGGFIKGDVRKKSLLFEVVYLTVLAFVRLPEYPAYMAFAFIAGFQLNQFVLWLGIPFSTTIFSGNIRYAGQFLYDAVAKSQWVKLGLFLLVAGAFPLGVMTSTIVSRYMGLMATLPAAGLILIAVVMLHLDDRKDNSLKDNWDE